MKSAGRLLEFALTKERAALVKTGAMDPMKLLPVTHHESPCGSERAKRC